MVAQEDIELKIIGHSRHSRAIDLISSLFRNSSVAARIEEAQRSRCASSL